MPIDYSKWDHLDEYDDDDDDDDDEHSTDNPMEEASPRVTRLDAPSTVTFGGGQATIVAPSSSSSKQQQATITPAIMAPPSSTSPETRNATAPTPSASNTSTTAAASASSALAMNPKWSEKGGMVVLKDDDDDDDNAAKSRQLFWSQDRYSVTLRLQLLPAEVETSKKSMIRTVQVEGILPYEDRHCATGTCHQKLVVINKENTKLWEGTLPHPVHLAQDDDDIDWCLETTTTTTTKTLEDNKNNNNKKFLTIHLFKAVPMQGLFVWWKRPVMECDEQQGAASSDDTRDGASQEFLQAWEEAHRQFRAKKNNRPPPQPL